MNSDAILRADMLDILFENRNKAYGAYELRKHYNSRLGKAILITTAAIGAVILAASFPKTKAAELLVTKTYTDPGYGKILPPTMVAPPKPPVATKAPQTARQRTANFSTNIKMTNGPADPIQTITPGVAIGTQNITDAAPAVTSVTINPAPATVVSPTPGPDPEPTVDPSTPMETAEVMPSYPGGTKAMYEYLQRNLRTPDEMQPGETVKVKVKFVVSYTGELLAFDVVQDGGKIYSDEVLRVLRKMPKWLPGKAKGQNVSVFFTLPVTFTIAE